MSHQINDDRCPYVCTDTMTIRGRTREDGWRCGETEGHGSPHTLYTSGGGRVMYQGVGWEIPADPQIDDHPGSNPSRQEQGLPGHCEDCAEQGHVEAHPELGCSDVGCTTDHLDKIDTWTAEVIDETFGAIEIDGANYLIDDSRERIHAQGSIGIPLVRYADTGEIEAKLTAWIELEIHEENH